MKEVMTELMTVVDNREEFSIERNQYLSSVLADPSVLGFVPSPAKYFVC